MNDLPYLNLKPPGLSGIDKTGRPEITSSKVDSLGFLLSESLSDWMFSNHSQSEMLRSLINLNNFLLRPIIPSFNTLKAPPRRPFVVILSPFSPRIR